jgi:hypothetical protein
MVYACHTFCAQWLPFRPQYIATVQHNNNYNKLIISCWVWLRRPRF